MTDADQALILQTLDEQHDEIEELLLMACTQARMLTAIDICLSAADIPDGKTTLDRVEMMRSRYERLLGICRKARDLLSIYEENDN